MVNRHRDRQVVAAPGVETAGPQAAVDQLGAGRQQGVAAVDEGGRSWWERGIERVAAREGWLGAKVQGGVGIHGLSI